MKIMVTGPRGFVGRRIMEQYPDAVAAPSLQNITEQQVRELMERVQPDAIIHTAAISDMPSCERDPEGSYRANVELPILLAKYAGGAKLAFFSSDQVYNGCKFDGPYDEHIVAPANLYAKEKLEMEQKVLEIDPNAVMLRAEWMYDYIAPKGNFLLNALNAKGPLTYSSKQYRGITYLREVAEAMDAVLQLPGGAYNFGSETEQDMNTVAKEFFAWMGLDIPVLDCDGLPNLWMDCSKATKQGVLFSKVPDALKKCVNDYGLKGK